MISLAGGYWASQPLLFCNWRCRRVQWTYPFPRTWRVTASRWNSSSKEPQVLLPLSPVAGQRLLARTAASPVRKSIAATNGGSLTCHRTGEPWSCCSGYGVPLLQCFVSPRRSSLSACPVLSVPMPGVPTTCKVTWWRWGRAPVAKGAPVWQANWGCRAVLIRRCANSSAQHCLRPPLAGCPDIAIAKDLTMPFVDMIRHHRGDTFGSWLTQIRDGQIPELRGFVRGSAE